MGSVDWLYKNFIEVFKLPEDAAAWLCQLFDALQFLDDVVDGDPISRESSDVAIWDLLVGIQLNPFYIQNSYQLLPLISVLILKWQASDSAERNGRADEKSYMWRAGYYDLVLHVVTICHGWRAATGAAEDVMRLYGETFKDYQAEFSKCQIQS